MFFYLQGNSRCLFVTLVAAISFAIGCDGTGETAVGTGAVTVILEAEDVITDGLVPGDETENIRDGWAVTFDKYIITIGDIDLHLSTDESTEAEAETVFVVDLVQTPASGFELWTLEGLQEGRWEFNYSTPGAGDGSTRHESVSEEDHQSMVSNDWTYHIDGVLSRADGQSCPPASLLEAGEKTPNGNMSGENTCYDAPEVRFTFGAAAETSFGPCEIDEVPGFAVTAGATQTIAATIHGDHLFFNGFPEGDEGGSMRLAQWLADCDLNLDGTVTQAELEAIAPSLLPEIDDRFQLGGSPITPIENMYDYLRSQLKTQGHFQGEGECPADGVAHEHGGHDDHGDGDHDGHGEGEHDDHGDEDHDGHGDGEHDDHGDGEHED